MEDMDKSKEEVKRLLEQGFCDVEICEKLGINWERFLSIFYNIWKEVSNN